MGGEEGLFGPRTRRAVVAHSRGHLDPDLLRRTEPAYVHEADLLKSTVKPEPMRSPFARRQFSRKALDYRPTYRRNRGAPQGKHPSWIRWSRRHFSCAGNALRPARRLG